MGCGNGCDNPQRWIRQYSMSHLSSQRRVNCQLSNVLILPIFRAPQRISGQGNKTYTDYDTAHNQNHNYIINCYTNTILMKTDCDIELISLQFLLARLSRFFSSMTSTDRLRGDTSAGLPPGLLTQTLRFLMMTFISYPHHQAIAQKQPHEQQVTSITISTIVFQDQILGV